MHKLRTMLTPPGDSSEEEINQLRDRLTELQDVNARLRRLDETIQKNERLFERLLLRSHEGIVLVSQDLIILRLIHSSLGFQEMDVSGQPILPFIHPDDAPDFLKLFGQVVNAHAKSVSCDFRAENKTGNWVWVRCDMTDLLDDPTCKPSF
jgi:PAS domain S-box-containing protein